MLKLSVVIVCTAILSGWSTAQAFGFCFNFGGGGNNRTDFYNRPPAIGFGPGVQYFPYSPVAPVPQYAPYHPVPRSPRFYEGRMPGPIERRQEPTRLR